MWKKYCALQTKCSPFHFTTDTVHKISYRYPRLDFGLSFDKADHVDRYNCNIVNVHNCCYKIVKISIFFRGTYLNNFHKIISNW